MPRAAINERAITDAVLRVAHACAEHDLELVVGGSVAVEAAEAEFVEGVAEGVAGGGAGGDEADDGAGDVEVGGEVEIERAGDGADDAEGIAAFAAHGVHGGEVVGIAGVYQSLL
eukprot:gene10303-13072_t